LIVPLRTVDPGRISMQEFAHHRIRLTIDHEPLAGVTPDMLLWWFSHLAGTMPYAGGVHPRYTVWHPLDHIRWELARAAPGGGAAEGARFHIVETLGQDRRRLVDSVDRVEKLDRTGIRLVMRLAGAQVFQLEHTWSEGRGRTHVFRPDMDLAWIKHNIEEVGLLEHFLPTLYATEQ
jgi:hypothetical protein